MTRPCRPRPRPYRRRESLDGRFALLIVLLIEIEPRFFSKYLENEVIMDVLGFVLRRVCVCVVAGNRAPPKKNRPVGKKARRGKNVTYSRSGAQRSFRDET